MQMQVHFADKLITAVERHTGELSEEWCVAVRKNPRTPWYHSMSQDQCVLHAFDFFKNLRRVYFSEKPYDEVATYFKKYAKETKKERIPLHEAIYALVMMRRHIWLLVERQSLVMTGLDLQQCVESINTMIRIFDHGTYVVINEYA